MITVVLVEAPVMTIAFGATVTGVVQVQVPAGIPTMSPSDAALSAACTSDCEQEAARKVGVRGAVPVGGGGAGGAVPASGGSGAGARVGGVVTAIDAEGYRLSLLLTALTRNR